MAGDEAVKFLTTQGFKNVVMTMPRDTEQHTKVVVFMYPVILDPNFLVDDDRFV